MKLRIDAALIRVKHSGEVADIPVLGEPMDVNALANLFYVLSGAILALWSVESALATPGSRSLLVCGMLMAGVAFGLPRAL